MPDLKNNLIGQNISSVGHILKLSANDKLSRRRLVLTVGII
jgi:hypothetical protein